MDFALYLISLILFSALTVLAVFFFPKWKNALLVDIVSVSLITGLYLVFVLTRYLDVGIYDWNFQNALPTANVSPFMFFTLPIFFLLRGRARKVFAALIALLSVGMFLSPTISIIRYMAIGYAFHLHFLLDFIAHYLLCLFGIYLVRTEQASLEKKDVLIGGSLIVGVAILMLVINLILDTSFFGLNLRGKHSIYNIVLTKNSYLSALLYFFGLVSVLALGYLLQRLLCFKKG